MEVQDGETELVGDWMIGNHTEKLEEQGYAFNIVNERQFGEWQAWCCVFFHSFHSSSPVLQ